MFDLALTGWTFYIKVYLKKQMFISSKKKKINPGAAILRQNLEKKGVDLSLGIFQGECPGHYQRQSPSTPRLCRVSWGAGIKKDQGLFLSFTACLAQLISRKREMNITVTCDRQLFS